MTTKIDTGAVEGLRTAMLGEVVEPDNDSYEAVRRIWNGDIDRRPLLIARCQGPADVMAAVRCAREHDAPASVRGGGHAVAGYSVCDGGFVIDLSPMTGARVDPVARTVRVQGGCLNEHLDRESQVFGLATTSGFISHTGVAGLTLGGGIGHLMRKFGLSVDNLRSCDVVTADGELVVASANENPDLFWGLHGGGGNFGVVTSIELQLHPLGPEVLAGMVAWPMDDAPKVLRFVREFAASAPDEVGIMGNLRLAPPLPVVPEELHGKPIAALVLTYAGPPDEGAEVFRALDELGPPAINSLMPKPYTAHQKSLDAAAPHGNGYYWKSHKLGPLGDDMIDVIVEHASQITSPKSTIPIFTQGGAVARVPEDATAFPNRDAAHDLNIVGSWALDDPEPERHVAWVRGFFEALEPYSKGVYVNFVSDDPSSRVAHCAYSPGQWERLVGLKAKYDPTNFFRMNANIPPDADVS